MKEYGYLDLHVAGEPFRLLTDGVPEIRGKTMAERRLYAMTHLDALRKLALLEPRGHDDMYGGFLTPPVNPGSDFGVVFIHGTGMSTMCGHGIIALSRAAVELQIVNVQEGVNEIAIDAPSGTVKTQVDVKNGRVNAIHFCNDLSFSYGINQKIKTPSYGDVKVDIGYGGAFMVFADVNQFKRKLCRENIPDLIDIAMECGRNAIEQLNMVHPERPGLNAKDNGICMILLDMEEIDDRMIRTKTFTVFGEGQFDRSPTGTGTSALAAVLQQKGILTEEKTLENRGISDVPFRVTIKIVDDKVIPTIHSNAYITGKGVILVEKEDPLQNGFTIKAGK